MNKIKTFFIFWIFTGLSLSVFADQSDSQNSQSQTMTAKSLAEKILHPTTDAEKKSTKISKQSKSKSAKSLASKTIPAQDATIKTGLIESAVSEKTGSQSTVIRSTDDKSNESKMTKGKMAKGESNWIPDPVVESNEQILRLKTEDTSILSRKNKWELVLTIRPHQVRSKVEIPVSGESFQYNTADLSRTWMPSLEVLKDSQLFPADSGSYLFGFGMSDQKIELKTPSYYSISARLQSYELKLGWQDKKEVSLAGVSNLKSLYSLEWVEYLVMQTSADSLGRWQQQISLGRLTAGLEWHSVQARFWLQSAFKKNQNLKSDNFNFELGRTWTW